MKRILSLLCILLMAATGCALQAPAEQTPAPQLAKSPYSEVNTLIGVYIETEQDAYPADTEEITLIWTNQTARAYIFGLAFLVEQNVNGVWYVLPMQENAAFNDIAYILEPNSTRAQRLSLAFAYGALPEGTYRIVMQAITQTEEDAKNYPLTAEFDITSDATPPPESPESPIALPTPIPGTAKLTAAEVLSIERYNSLNTPYMPSEVWASEKDVASMLGFMQAIRLSGYYGPERPQTLAPEEQYSYILRCFDGSELTLDFVSGTLSFGEGYYAFALPNMEPPAQPVLLAMQQYNWPAGAEEIGYTILNRTGDTVNVVLAPKLEHATDSGWVNIPVDGGFCGVADPVGPDGLTSTLPFSAIYPTAGEGMFRLSFTAYDEANEEYDISTVFTIGSVE